MSDIFKFGAAVLLLLLLGGLLHLSNSVDIERHVRTVERLRLLKQLDATLNQYVLQTRFGILENYDSIVTVKQQMDRVLDDLKQDTPQYFVDREAPANAAFVRYLEVLHGKDTLVERFKSFNAVLKNSLRYFPIAVRDLLASRQAGTQQDRLLHSLLENVLLYDHEPSNPQGQKAIEGELSRLLQLGSTEALQTIGKHVEVILAYKSAVDEQLREISLAPTSARNDEVFDLYSQQFIQEVDRAARYKQWLALLALALAGYVVWAVARLNSTRNALETEHQLVLAQTQLLQESESHLSAIVNTALDAIIGIDVQGRITDWSARAEIIFGWRKDEVLGLTLDATIIPAQHWDAHQRGLARFLADGGQRSLSRRMEITALCRNGKEFPAELAIIYRKTGATGHFTAFIADITERKASEEKINELNRDFVSFLENTTDFIYFKDANNRFRFCSQTLAHITGHASWRDMIGKYDLEVFRKEIAQIYFEEELPIFREGIPLLNKIDPYLDATGRKGWVSTNKWPLLDQAGKVVGLFGISRDITEHKQTEEKLSLAASVFSHSREGIMITAADGTIIDVNDAFNHITGYARGDVLGKNPRLLSSGLQGKEFYAAMWGSLLDKGHWYGEVWNRRKSGEVYAEMLTISTVRDAQGQPQHFVALFSDISTLKAHQKQLEHIAHFDALTSLPNRVLLADRLHQAIAQSERRGQLLAVAFLDLDGFKAINDRYGHEAGDQLLIALAGYMKQALREGDTIARIGGDEFVAILVDLVDVHACVPMLNHLLAAASHPVRFGNTDLQVSASLGVTFFPQPEDADADLLLRQADQAMYQAKLAGKNRYHVFDAEQDRTVRGHHESVERVRKALTEGEFVLYYQPKVNMRSGAIIGAEALIRWQHPDKGLLAPATFLPVIEDHPLAIDLGEWVIDTALTQMERWRADDGLAMPVSVNIGARQLQQPDFVKRLRSILATHPTVLPADLALEVLETSALEDLVHVSRVIEDCRDMGVMFALDDFGTGYSSLTYLKRLPVTQLKIDQSFVRGMLDDPDDLAILEGVIGLATAFRRQVIAEGVETVAHGALLLQLGCELAQGFGIAHPMPAQALPAWAAGWHTKPAWGPICRR